MKNLDFIVIIIFTWVINFCFGQSSGTLDLSYGMQGNIKINKRLEDLVIYQSVIKSNG